MALVLPVLGYSGVGVCSSTACPGMWKALMARCSRPAVGFVVVRLMGSRVSIAGFRRRARAHGQRSMGCVPGRSTSTVCCICGSSQSLCAKVLLQPLMPLPFSFFSGEGLAAVGGGRRRRVMVLRSGKDLMDLVVIFSLSKVFSAKECGQLSPVYLPSTFLYLYCLVFVFFLV